MTTTKMYAVRDFKDAGSEKEFKAGAVVEGAAPGELENYAAAGLISDKKPTAKKLASTPAPVA